MATGGLIHIIIMIVPGNTGLRQDSRFFRWPFCSCRGQQDPPFFRVRVLAEEDGHMADNTGHLGMGAFGKFLYQLFFLVFEVVETHLDEFMCSQGGISRCHNRIGEPLFPDEHHRIEAVCLPAQEFALSRTEGFHIFFPFSIRDAYNPPGGLLWNRNGVLFFLFTGKGRSRKK